MLMPSHAVKLKHLIYACCCWWLLLFTGSASAAADDKLNIFVSVLPQKYIVERIAGDLAEVNAMVQPGYSPATYEPNPRQISKLSKADLYIRVGVPFENSWMSRIRAVNLNMPVLDARGDLPLRTLEVHNHNEKLSTDYEENDSHDEHDEHETNNSHAAHDDEHQRAALKPAQDPHIWTSPRLVKRMAVQITEQLSTLRPNYQEQFTANLALFTAELEQLDQELSALFAETKQRSFMVFHPSWGYFADAYNLTQVPIEVDGKEPGAKALAALIKQARQKQVKTIFIQPQFDSRIAKQVASAIEGEVITIDPLAEDYLNSMRQAARRIAGVEGE